MYNLYYHGGSDNHGCEAIVRSTHQLFQGIDFRLYTSAIAEDRANHLDDIVALKEDTYVSVSRKSVNFFKCYAQLKLHHSEYLFIKYGHQELMKDVVPGQLWFSIGGDNYCYNGVEILGYYNRMIHEKGGKTILWGCSIEPDVLTPEVVEDLKRYDLITVRESLSCKGLHDAGIINNVVLCSDPAFQLEKGTAELPKGFRPENTIGINLSPLVLDCAPLVLGNYETLIKYILEETEYQIALIPHVVKADNDDRIPLKLLYDKFASDRICLIDNQNCMELKSIISKCKMFVGARTHATIAAYSTCVPTLVTGYSIKARGIAKDIFGTDENYVISVQSMSESGQLTEAFKWLELHESKIREHLIAFMPEYRQKAYRAVDAVEKVIENK